MYGVGFGRLIILDILDLYDNRGGMWIDNPAVILNDHTVCSFVTFLCALPTFGPRASTIDIFSHVLLNYMYKISSIFIPTH